MRPQIVETSLPVRTPAGWQPLSAGTGTIGARLVNGVFGDPLLEVKFRNRRERLLFDLGDAAALSRRVLHTVTDIFLTHAHFDHICGFLHVLRARMTGEYPPCRIYGLPGTASRIESLIGGIHWDRIENAGPEFLVADVYGQSLEWSHLKAGHASAHLEPQPLPDGVICRQPEYRVRCTELDHGIPVLAFALEYAPRIHIDRERLTDLSLEPGAWITALKRHLRDGDTRAVIELPDGSARTVAELAEALVVASPGERLAYATDFADTAENRHRLSELADGADLFFCEATFCAADAAQAQETRHLTVRACAEIARAAKVERLVPFHFSKRYTRRPEAVYAELHNAMDD
ncbi:MAG: MBL fold metallo-hydrolase [Pseudomonadales bacterium]